MINSLRVIRAMINKEKTDILRNKKMLIIMFIFPVIYLFITFAGIQEFKGDGSAFVLMHSIMVPIQIIASIVAEEKEKGTFKMLMMSGVRAFEYIIGIMVIVMMFLVFGMVIFDQTGATKNSDTFEAVIVNMIAFILSMMIGFIIGVISDNQVSVGAVSLPVTLIIFFMPIVGMFNEKYEFLGKYLYSGVLFKILNGTHCLYPKAFSLSEVMPQSSPQQLHRKRPQKEHSTGSGPRPCAYRSEVLRPFPS